MANAEAISGYDYGMVSRSPVTMAELTELKATMGWGPADRAAMRRAADLLVPHAEALVDGWRAIIGGQVHLAHWFVHPDGSPNDEYKAAVKRRFVQWVRDTLTKPFDQDWLDYQDEIGRRHTPAKKNRTDAADTPAKVPLRFLLAFMPPTLFAVSDLLERKGVGKAERDAITRAWTKAIALTLALWSKPYVAEDLW